jgi:predicted DNA-binding transcriptional regulator YafY
MLPGLKVSCLKNNGEAMSQQGVIKRYSLIIKKIKESYYPSLPEIRHFLALKGFEVSDRTIQRDFKQLDQEFGLKVTFSRIKRGYGIDKGDEIQAVPFLRFLELFDTADIISESLSNNRETIKFISFDNYENARGTDFLKPLLKAAREHKVVCLTYQNFCSSEKKNYEVLPYLLKEYQGRWYLIACFPDKKKLYIFGLDRILEVQATAKSFKPDKGIDPHRRLNSLIGVSASDDPPEKVLLSFTPHQSKYIKTLPLHHTQRILLDNEKECRIELFVRINYELLMKILSYGSTVKVVSPSSLAGEIKKILTKALNSY